MINIRIADDTIIETENSKDYKSADIVMEIHEATSKQVEWNQAKKIIYKLFLRLLFYIYKLIYFHNSNSIYSVFFNCCSSLNSFLYNLNI